MRLSHSCPRMLFILLFCSALRYLQAAPQSNVALDSVLLSSDTAQIVPREDIVFVNRDLSDIITTCLATIFACTWTAIHPNIPSPVDSTWELFTRRVTMSICAILTPELITVWALRQYIAAKRITQEYNTTIADSNKISQTQPHEQDQLQLLEHGTHKAHIQVGKPGSQRISARIRKGLLWLPKKIFCSRPLPTERLPDMIQPWTTAHGFFVQMGGFMLSKNGVPLRTLRFYPENTVVDISALISSNCIAAPTITEEEIKDRSKGNFLSKLVVIGHTTWFLAQCIARWATGLTVTELEVVTLGYVVLNGITYAFWWNKPQDVGCPVYVEWISPNPAPPALSKCNKTSNFRLMIGRMARTWNICFIMLHVFTALFVASIYPIMKLAMVFTADRSMEESEPKLRVARFFHDDVKNPRTLTTLVLPMTAAAVVFGSVHLIPVWTNHFWGSPSQMHLWRFCAAFTTGFPVLFAIGYIFYKHDAKSFMSDMVGPLGCAALVYFLARIGLLVLAIISLFDLPHTAYLTIEWISMIPHL